MSGTGLKRPEAQALLGRFLFSGWDEHEKPVAVLSGGERRRLALAIVVASGANFLVLDEPTNHLDLESRESLEAALEAFPGTVLLVSHDRALLDAVADRLLAVEDRTIASYPGGWADYVRAQEADEAPAAPPPKPKPKREKPKRPAEAEATRRSSSSRQEVARAEERVASSSGSSPTTGATPTLARRAPRRARGPRGAAQPLGSAVRSERIDGSVIGSSTRITSSAPAAASARQLVREPSAGSGGASGCARPLARAALDLDEQADAALAPRPGRVPPARTPRRCARSAAGSPRRGCRSASNQVFHAVDVRQRRSRAGAAPSPPTISGGAARRRRQQHRVLDAR